MQPTYSYRLLTLVLTGVFVLLWANSQPTALAQDVAIPEYTGRAPDQYPILAPCSRFDEAYEDLGYLDKPIEEWKKAYHDAVSEVVAESLEQPKIECTATDYDSLLQPGTKLEELAKKLPPWQKQDDDDANEVSITRFDISRVLLEHLRVYECALSEYYEFRYYDTAAEEFRKEEEETGSERINFFDYFISDLVKDTNERSAFIIKEKTIARTALHRTLTILGTMDRLLPLQAELECMQRMSLDIRNIAGLAAETSSCMPRTWNAKDVLRDYQEEE